MRLFSIVLFLPSVHPYGMLAVSFCVVFTERLSLRDVVEAVYCFAKCCIHWAVSRRETRSVETMYGFNCIPSGCSKYLFDGLKYITFIIFNSEFFQKINVFFCECSFSMMFFLCFNISAHIGNLAFAIWKCPKSFLPWEFPFHKMIGIYPRRRISFHLLH